LSLRDARRARQCLKQKATTTTTAVAAERDDAQKKKKKKKVTLRNGFLFLADGPF
jgi:hypothetical protein